MNIPPPTRRAWRALALLLPALAASQPALAGAPIEAVPLAAAAASPSPVAVEPPATAAIHRANDRLRSLLQAEDAGVATAPAAVTRALRDLLDIGYLSQRALVDHWPTMNARQRTELVSTLQSIIERTYLTQLRGNLDYQVDYLPEQVEGDEVTVRTLIRASRNGRPSRIAVDYRLHQEKGRWRIFDVLTEDVSILNNYRGQFNRLIAKQGVAGLITRMKTKLAGSPP